MNVKERIAAFRARMAQEEYAAVVVPTADSHASEYIADRFKTRQWLCGFTGSAGTLVVGREEAALFTDGRYFIQAERQLAGSGVTLMRMGTPGVPTLEAYVAQLARPGESCGVDFSVVSRHGRVFGGCVRLFSFLPRGSSTDVGTHPTVHKNFPVAGVRRENDVIPVCLFCPVFRSGRRAKFCLRGEG